MKKYLFLVVICALSTGAAYYLYSKNSGQLSAQHTLMFKTMDQAEYIDQMMQKSILENRNFLTFNYDDIVRSENEIDRLCIALKTNKSLKDVQSDSKLIGAINAYCAEMEKKVASIETFKTKMSLFKNSLFYIHKFATESAAINLKALTAEEEASFRRLVKSAIVYATVSTDSSKALLQKNVEACAGLTDSEAGLLILHAKKILATKSEMDLVIRSVVRSRSEALLANLRAEYIQFYREEQMQAYVLHVLLVSACIFLLGVVAITIGLVFKYSSRLEDANKYLEQRVSERTRELEKTQETIVQQQQALMASSKLSALGEMAGGVAHEINNPLGIISLRVEQMLEAIEDGAYSEAEFKASLDVVSKTSMRIAKIVRGLRTFARDGNKDPFVKSSVKDIIDDTLSLCGEKFTHHGVTLRADYQKFTGSLECRPVELSQVFLNLLNNAYDAVQPLKDKWVSIDIVDEGEHYLIRFKDSGYGIPEHVRGKLMQPFFTTKDIGKGTGLGLSISRGIIDSHHGKIYLDTHCPNTCFVVVLPKSQQQAGPSPLEGQAA